MLQSDDGAPTRFRIGRGARFAPRMWRCLSGDFRRGDSAPAAAAAPRTPEGVAMLIDFLRAKRDALDAGERGVPTGDPPVGDDAAGSRGDDPEFFGRALASARWYRTGLRDVIQVRSDGMAHQNRRLFTTRK